MRAFSRLAFTAIILGLLASALVAGPALAAKGGKPGSGASAATVTVSPNPAAAGGTLVLASGCGYAFAPAQVRVVHATYTETYGVGVWYTGCLDTAYFATRETGTYTVEVWQGTSKKASTTLNVI